MSVTDYSITKFQNYVHIKLLKNAFPRWSQQQKHVQFKWNHYLGNMSMCWQFYHIRYFELETFLKQIFFIIFTKKEIFHLFLLKKKYFCCVGVYFFYLFLKFFSSSTKIIKKPQFKSTSKTKYLIMEKLPICGHSKRNIKRNRNMDSERERNTDRQKTIQWNN